jgi:hypothetical protein
MKGDQIGILAAYPTPRELPLSNWTWFRTATIFATGLNLFLIGPPIISAETSCPHVHNTLDGTIL